MELTNREKVAALLNSYGIGDREPLQYINAEKFIQHNLAVSDGQDLNKLVMGPFSGSVKIVRLFEDAQFVFAHVEYELPVPAVGFEVFRFEDGQIVEHWDNLQQANGSGSEGSTWITDLDKTAENKTLARNIVHDILIKGKLEKLDDYFDGTNYVNGNSWFADAVSGFINKVKKWARQDIKLKYARIHQVLGEGNFALVMSEGNINGVHSGFYDLFRIENGKIAEHWDTTEAIPSSENHNNINGKFRKEVWDLGFWLY